MEISNSKFFLIMTILAALLVGVLFWYADQASIGQSSNAKCIASSVSCKADNTTCHLCEETCGTINDPLREELIELCHNGMREPLEHLLNSSIERQEGHTEPLKDL